MDLSPLGVRATAGTLRAVEGVVLHHTWNDEGVVAGPVANGGQLLHLSVALCVLNDTYREAERLGIEVGGVAVEADGGFDDEWRSTGIDYSVTLDSRAPAEDLARLGAVVDEVAEIPRAVRAGAVVERRAWRWVLSSKSSSVAAEPYQDPAARSRGTRSAGPGKHPQLRHDSTTALTLRVGCSSRSQRQVPSADRSIDRSKKVSRTTVDSVPAIPSMS